MDAASAQDAGSQEETLHVVRSRGAGQEREAPAGGVTAKQYGKTVLAALKADPRLRLARDEKGQEHLWAASEEVGITLEAYRSARTINAKQAAKPKQQGHIDLTDASAPATPTTTMTTMTTTTTEVIVAQDGQQLLFPVSTPVPTDERSQEWLPIAAHLWAERALLQLTVERRPFRSVMIASKAKMEGLVPRGIKPRQYRMKIQAALEADPRLTLGKDEHGMVCFWAADERYGPTGPATAAPAPPSKSSLRRAARLGISDASALPAITTPPSVAAIPHIHTSSSSQVIKTPVSVLPPAIKEDYTMLISLD